MYKMIHMILFLFHIFLRSLTPSQQLFTSSNFWQSQGWNIYQREWFQSKGSLRPDAFKAELRLCSQKWANEPDDVRESFEDKANYEQYLREEAMKQPFTSKKGTACQGNGLGQAAFDAVSELCPKALKKISQPRLVETYRRYQLSDSWSESSGGLSSADGCLRVDLIDLDTPQKDIKHLISRALDSPLQPSRYDLDLDDPDWHHETCWEVWGHCHKKAHAQLARNFVRSFKQFLAMSILAASSCSGVEEF